MVSQYVWIGIVVGLFFVGIGIGYSIQPNILTVHTMMTPQQMQQMMSNSEQMAQWQQTMMDNPDAMNQWMNNPQHVRQMTELMSQNHDFMQQMMTGMINDPNIRLQMLGHMTEYPEMMQQLSELMTGNMTEMMNHP